MCGRYALGPVPGPAWADIKEAFGDDVEAQLASLQPRFNIAPTTQIPIVVQDRKTRQMQAMLARWGLIPHWWGGKSGLTPLLQGPIKLPQNTINARSEDAADKPMWRDAWKFARCLIPATHWYEWRHDAGTHQPFAMHMQDGKVFCFAGLYAWWNGPVGAEAPPTNDGRFPMLSAAILTRAAAPTLQDVHDRMPVVLNANVWREWLDPEMRDAGRVRRLLDVSAIMDVMAYKVRPLVNSPKNDGPELLEPMGEP